MDVESNRLVSSDSEEGGDGRHHNLRKRSADDNSPFFSKNIWLIIVIFLVTCISVTAIFSPTSCPPPVLLAAPLPSPKDQQAPDGVVPKNPGQQQASEGVLPSFTFGLTCVPNSNFSMMQEVVNSFDAAGIPPSQYETIIVGCNPHPPLIGHNVTVIPDNPALSDKQRIIIALASYEILFLAHDYIGVGPGWYEGWVRYGLHWDWIVPAGTHRVEGDILRHNRLLYSDNVETVAGYIGRGRLETLNATVPIEPWDRTKPWVPVEPWDKSRGPPPATGFPFGRYIKRVEPLLTEIKRFLHTYIYFPPDLDLERPASAAAYSSGELFILKTRAARAVPPLIDIDHGKPDDIIYSLILASRYSFRVNPHVSVRWFKKKEGPYGADPTSELMSFLLDNGLASRSKAVS